jgi:hypothetical protein
MGKRHGLSGKNLHRFVENSWFALYYPTMVVSGIIVLWPSVWLWDPVFISANYPDDHMGAETTGFRAYYITCCGFYLQALFALIFIDERMKDFYEMLTHHIATVCLIAVSLTTL